MGHTPYGYKIENGSAVVVEKEAETVKQIFLNYLSGMSLSDAAKSAGFPIVHSMVKRMLGRKCYLGDDFYPKIIDEETFSKANAELYRRAAETHRIGKSFSKKPVIHTEFVFETQQFHYENPFQQAEYIYSLIGIKVK